MADKTLSIQLEGSIQDDGNVRLNDFINELVAIKETLVGIDHTITKGTTPSTDYKIIDLKRGSAELVLEAVPIDPKADIATAVLDKFVAGIRQIQENSVPDEFDSALLEKFAKIGWVLGRKVTRISFAREGKQVIVGKTFSSQVKTIIGEDELAAGSIDGMLEQINIHMGANIFVIYPTLGPKEVRCHFPKELEKLAIEGLGKYVGVAGKLRYKKRDKFPNAIDVTKVEIHPDDKDLPSIFDLKGIAKGATGNLSSEKFIRQIRNASA